jgi:drug/metabolite transporter (DMT)-like permease
MLVLVALFFFNAKTKVNSVQSANEEKKGSFKWLLAAVSAAMATGFAVFFTKRNSLQYPDYFKEYLLLLCAVTVLAALPYIIWAAIKRKIRLIPDIRFLYLTAAMAVIQDIYNIIYTIYIGRFSSAFFFPIIGVTATLAVTLSSRIFLREKLSSQANIGIIISIAAIVFLSL